MTRLVAPAKLTRGLRVTGRRPDGLHSLEAEMVSLDLADELWFAPAGESSVTVAGPAARGVAPGRRNLVLRALEAVGRTAAVDLLKRIPAGGGLGGGSADAAAVLRWAGCDDRSVALGLGSDVPFCVTGGRALVSGVGETVEPLEFVPLEFTLLLVPLAVSTPAVYAAWDDLGGPTGYANNDLEQAALAVEPGLARWRDALRDATGAEPVLAGSGGTWYVEGAFEDAQVAGADVVVARAVRPGWDG